MKKLIIVFLILSINKSYSQFNAFRDEGLAYNKLILDQYDGTKYDIISIYKVVGTPFLFGENTGNAYDGDGQSSLNSLIRYNTYSQKLEIVANEKREFVIKKMEEVDSFNLIANDNTFYKNDLHFIRGTLLDKSKNNFMQVIVVGKNASLYKAYFSDLGIVSTNYVQSELRQYDLKFDYYYFSQNTNGLKKIKLSNSWLEKEFPQYDLKDLDKTRLSQNSESALKEIFKKINE